jgi:predicted peroxiredoxin
MNYRDMTFCPFTECAQFNNCDRAYTDKVRADAVKWMGVDAPVSLYLDAPSCFVKQEVAA